MPISSLVQARAYEQEVNSNKAVPYVRRKGICNEWWQEGVGVDQKSVHPLAANDGGFLC